MPNLPSDRPPPPALFTDLYELTMAQAYAAEGLNEPAVFELYFRRMPSARNYLLAAGLEEVLRFLEAFRFSAEDVDYLRGLELFSPEFLRDLPELRFTGDVYAVPEGTIVFPNEPLIQVVAPLIEAQLAETLILNQLHVQTLTASKAARVVLAAAGRSVVEFGSRRAHGVDAALVAARVAYLAGAAGTSNVWAGKLYGIPVFGTMAHSYIQAHDDERRAFEAFARQFAQTTLLVDTFDTLAGVRQVIELARRMGDHFTVQAVRLDSGDLADLARQTRRLLDEAGLVHVTIFASSGLDEFSVRDLVQGGAPIDAFGVGTRMAVSADAPAVDMAYKLVEYAGKPRTKLSSGKVLLPGRKQVFRSCHDGQFTGDQLGCWEESLPGEPLLVPVMRGGRRTAAGQTTLTTARQRARDQLAHLSPEISALEHAANPYTVQVSAALQAKLELLRRHFASH